MASLKSWRHLREQCIANIALRIFLQQISFTAPRKKITHVFLEQMRNRTPFIFYHIWAKRPNMPRNFLRAFCGGKSPFRREFFAAAFPNDGTKAQTCESIYVSDGRHFYAADTSRLIFRGVSQRWQQKQTERERRRWQINLISGFMSKQT